MMANDNGTVYLIKTDDREKGIADLLENYDMSDFKD